jgi:ubiquinone/menaquinone biosynthesis C-methylase UbiE
MLPRTLEPEVMDTADEAADYDAMDHTAVNRIFVSDLLAAAGNQFSASDAVRVLDLGTGTAQIPIELCRQLGSTANWHITAIDLADEMLKLARHNVERAGLGDHIALKLVDSKSLPFDDGSFDVVMSNSIVHHIPRPIDCLREMWRVLKPGGLIFVRDLYRPPSVEIVESLVSQYAGNESPRQQQLFRQSFHAALTVEEMQALIAECGIKGAACRMTSDRHWTLS